jgi:sugar phosphate isomerase/epimerase
MDTSITTDYAADRGDASPYFAKIADAGFTHIHWCHEWCTDYSYSSKEVERIDTQLRDVGLLLLDLHGTSGSTCHWLWPDTDGGHRGLDLVRNRLDMTARLGGATVVMHYAQRIEKDADRTKVRARLLCSLEELQEQAVSLGVRIALEPCPGEDIPGLAQALDAFDNKYLGLCLDTGHANLDPAIWPFVEEYRDRIVAVHIHDNDGTGDQHLIPYSAGIDWERTAVLLASSGYTGCVSLEVGLKGHGEMASEEQFLAAAHDAACRLSDEVAKNR